MRLLMCRPDFFSIEYEINPWMHIANQVNHGLALKQWKNLFKSYQESGATIELINPVAGLPDMVFTANGGIVYNTIFISSHQRFRQRQGEESYFQKWFADHQYTVVTLNHYQSGEGDALWYREQLYLAYGFRSELAAHREVSHILGQPVISLELVDPQYYDFDTCFCPIADQVVLYYPGAFSKTSCALIEQLPGAVALTQKEAHHLVTNSILVGKTLFTQFINPRLRYIFKRVNIQVKCLDMSEFNKSGGGIKCLTLILES